MQHKARKSLGQHFLIDQAAIETIVATAALTKQDHAVEIGPGMGALTIPLSQQVGKLELIELDHNLIAALQQRFAHNSQVTVHHADALDIDLATLAIGNHPLHILGNLPYNISTPLLFHLFNQLSYIARMTFMLQKEVVNRIVAQPGNKNYGRLSVMSQFFCSPYCVFELGPASFSPPPKVDSAVIQLIPHPIPPWPQADLNKLSTCVKLAFSQRRKTLANSLASWCSRQQLLAAGFDPKRRAEELSVSEFVDLSLLGE